MNSTYLLTQIVYRWVRKMVQCKIYTLWRRCCNSRYTHSRLTFFQSPSYSLLRISDPRPWNRKIWSWWWYREWKYAGPIRYKRGRGRGRGRGKSLCVREETTEENLLPPCTYTSAYAQLQCSLLYMYGYKHNQCQTSNYKRNTQIFTWK